MVGWNAAAWVLWCLNHEFDNEGGNLHRITFRVMQWTSFLFPAVLMMQFARLYNAYDLTLEENANQNCLVTCITSKYFYQFDLVDSDFNNTPDPEVTFMLDVDMLYNHWLIVLAAITSSVGVSWWAYPMYRAQFDQAMAMKEMEEEMTEEEMTEEE